MSRPKPTILITHTDKKTHTTDQILAASAIWAVFYKDMPMNLKSETMAAEPKYKKCSFSNSGHALNLAQKLNKQFNCSDFSVYQLSSGTKLV